ncbi:MAG: hypothetical protein L6V93_07270 [Clostridiales bacterium]|nr:MAG: hypothetical protein L6V93_07270 [Clostridiales bacterium]
MYQTFIGIRDALNNALNPIEKEITYLNSLNLNYGDINRDVRDLQEKLNEIAETQSERIMANGAFFASDVCTACTVPKDKRSAANGYFGRRNIKADKQCLPSAYFEQFNRTDAVSKSGAWYGRHRQLKGEFLCLQHIRRLTNR